MKSKKRQKGGRKNMILIFLCVSFALLLFGGAGTTIYKYYKSINDIETQTNLDKLDENTIIPGTQQGTIADDFEKIDVDNPNDPFISPNYGMSYYN